MKQYFLSLILILLSNGIYVNTDYIQFIDVKEKWIKIDSRYGGYIHSSYWYLDVTEKDIEVIKESMGVYGDKK
jgi:predicted DNA-binding helix-hairpin-helix protein